MHSLHNLNRFITKIFSKIVPLVLKKLGTTQGFFFRCLQLEQKRLVLFTLSTFIIKRDEFLVITVTPFSSDFNKLDVTVNSAALAELSNSTLIELPATIIYIQMAQQFYYVHQ